MFKFNKKYIISAAGILVLINLVLIAVWLSVEINSNPADSDDVSRVIDTNTYQAVFLTNNQIYFGRLKNVHPSFLLLSEVHYVKVDENSMGRLVKLGQIEPHEPTNEMIINRDHVLFWENLRSDSSVVRNIQSTTQ